MSGKGVTARACQGLVWAGILLAAAPVGAWSQGGAIRVTTAGERAIRLGPSERASLPFRILSGGAPSGEIHVGVDVPAGWRAVAPPGLQLPGDSVALRVLSFFVPADAPAGRYTVRLRAVSRTGATGIDSVSVSVTQQVRLEVEIEEAPAWVAPRDTFGVRFRVSNRGNVPLDIAVQLDGSAGMRIHADTSSRRLEPGESSVIEAEATSRSSNAAVAAHTVRLAAHGGGDTATVTARVQVVDQGLARGADRGHSLPVQVRLRVSDGAGNLPGVRVSASGPLRRGGSTRAELLLQGPHTRHSIYSEVDAYRFSLESPTFSLQLGDRVYALSPLTEAGREGMGAAAGLRAGPLQAGGFVQRDRRSQTGSRQQAAFTRLHLGNIASIGANWLHHEDEYLLDRDVVSAQGTLRVPGGWLTADGEYGNRLDRPAHAHSLHVRGGINAFSVQLRHMRADSAYGGAYSGTMLDAAHITIRPWRQLFFEASADERASERVFAGSSFSAAERSARLALGYGAAVAEARYHSGARTSPWAVTDRTAYSAAVRLRLPLGALALMPRLEAGRSLDRLTGEPGTFWRGSTQSSLTTSMGSYTAAFEYFTGGTLHNGLSRAGMSASLSASGRPTNLTRLTLSASGTRYLEDQSHTSFLANASLEQQLPFDHGIALRASVRSTGGPFESRETLLMLDYTIPLRVPLAGGRASGSVSGRIYDGASGTPIERVIMEIGGRRSATDSRGRFEIRGLPAGTHHVQMDRSAPGTGRVPSEFVPATLEVRSGSTAELEIAMVAAARLEGRVVIVRQTAAAVAAGVRSENVPEGLSGAVIELSRGAERMRRTVDGQGRFDISDLRPGRWAVTVTSARLPQHYRFERDTVIVDVQPGERTAIELRAAGVERRIQMIATTELTVTEEAPVGQPSIASPARTAPPVTSSSPRVEPASPRVEPASPRVEPRSPRAEPRSAPAPAGAQVERTQTDLPSGWTLYTVPTYVSMLRGVARDVYLESGLWPKIWLANRDSVPDPDVVVPGTVLRIPPKAPLSRREEQAMYDHMRSRW